MKQDQYTNITLAETIDALSLVCVGVVIVCVGFACGQWLA